MLSTGYLFAGSSLGPKSGSHLVMPNHRKTRHACAANDVLGSYRRLGRALSCRQMNASSSCSSFRSKGLTLLTVLNQLGEASAVCVSAAALSIISNYQKLEDIHSSEQLTNWP